MVVLEAAIVDSDIPDRPIDQVVYVVESQYVCEVASEILEIAVFDRHIPAHDVDRT